MILDVELTLNRFGFSRPAPNKVQLGCVRFAVWRHPTKRAVSFEVNWKRVAREKGKGR